MQFGIWSFWEPIFWIVVEILEFLLNQWILLCVCDVVTITPHNFDAGTTKLEVERKSSSNIRKREFRSPRKLERALIFFESKSSYEETF